MRLYRFALLLLVLGVLAACGGDDEADVVESGETGDDTTASASAPTLVFDGSTCTYQGPTQVVVGGLTPLVLENTSDIDISAGVFLVRSETALNAALDRLPPGSGSDILLAPPPDSTPEAFLQAGPGGRNEENVLLGPGLYLMDCARLPPGGTNPDYVWRGGSFEGVEG